MQWRNSFPFNIFWKLSLSQQDKILIRLSNWTKLIWQDRREAFFLKHLVLESETINNHARALTIRESWYGCRCGVCTTLRRWKKVQDIIRQKGGFHNINGMTRASLPDCPSHWPCFRWLIILKSETGRLFQYVHCHFSPPSLFLRGCTKPFFHSNKAYHLFATLYGEGGSCIFPGHIKWCDLQMVLTVPFT